MRASLFGSVVRGEAHRQSDVDVLIEIPPEPGMDLFEFVGVKLELEDALGHRVDLVTYDTLKPGIKQRVLAEAVRIL